MKFPLGLRSQDERMYERGWKDAKGAIERLQEERDTLYGHVNGLLGLLQLVRGRDDMPAEISEVLNTNHRATDAAAYLTRIVPPIAT
jgi:hypothetical protein